MAGVVDYDQATLYVYTDSQGLKAKINKRAHQSQSVGRPMFGWDGSNDTRRFIGLMDDIRIYDYALTRDQIENIINEN